MALNFPDSPTLNQVYTDATSGFSYQWDGYVWQSYTPSATKNILIIDDISASFNGSTQTFALASSGDALTPLNAQQLRVVLGGIVQEPVTDYTVSGSNITFTTPPGSGLDCSIVSLGPAIPLSSIIDGSVTPAKLSTGGPSWNTSGDVYIAGITTIVNASGKVIAGIGTTALIVEGNARVTGILTVGTSSITLDGTTDTITTGTLNATTITGAVTGNATGLTGTPDIAVRNITGVAATFTGNVSIAGTLTYEDVTNVDSVGLITARSGIVVSSGVITAPAGSLSAPSYTFSGDNNTGLYSPGADQVTLVTGGTGRIAVDASGNVNIDSGTVYVDAANNRFGVGTTSPDAKLHLSGGAEDVALRISSSNGNAIFGVRNSAYGALSVGDQYIYNNGDNITLMAEDPSAVIKFASGGSSERARLDSSGRFGVGTNNPQQKIQAAGTGSQYVSVVSTDSDNTGILFGDNTTTLVDRGFVLYAHSDDSLRFGSSATERFRVGSSGQLGIAGANYGSSGQVLTSQGSGSAPQWADASGGLEVWISTITASGASTVDFTSNIDSTYKKYKIIGENISVSTNGADFNGRVSRNGGSTWQTGLNFGGYEARQGTLTGTGSASSNVFQLSGSLGVGAPPTYTQNLYTEVILHDPSNTSSYFQIEWRCVFLHQGGNQAMVQGSVTDTFNSAIDAIRFETSSGTFSGSFHLYGIKTT